MGEGSVPKAQPHPQALPQARPQRRHGNGRPEAYPIPSPHPEALQPPGTPPPKRAHPSPPALPQPPTAELRPQGRGFESGGFPEGGGQAAASERRAHRWRQAALRSAERMDAQRGVRDTRGDRGALAGAWAPQNPTHGRPAVRGALGRPGTAVVVSQRSQTLPRANSHAGFQSRNEFC